MNTLPRMRSFFRLICVVSSLAALLFYCSCERHKASELAHGEEHAKSAAGEYEHAEAADRAKHTDHDKARDTDQAIATTAMSVTPPPKQSPTPANFFPTATPH
jgi:hypothetical protein